MKDFTEQTHKFTNGHTCVPNGVGDFNLMCPDKGKVRFVPCFTYSAIKGDCPLCGKYVQYIEGIA